MWLVPIALQVTDVPVPPLALRWEVASSIGACPGARWFRAEAAAEFGRDPFLQTRTPGPVATVRVAARPSSGALLLEVFYRRHGGAEQSLLRSETTPARCRTVLDGVFGALHDVVLPRALPTAGDTHRHAPEPEPTAVQPTTIAPVVDVERPPPQLPVVAASVSPQPPTVPPTEEAPRWHGRVAVLGGVSFGGVVAPASPFLAASLVVSRGVLGLSAGAAAEPLAGGEATCDGRGVPEQVTLRRVQGELGVCVVGRYVGFCGLVIGRWVQARVATLEDARARDGYQIGGALRVEGTWPVTRGVTLLGRLDGSLASPAEFTVRVPQTSGATVSQVCDAWSVGPLSGAVSVGAAFGLW